MVRRLRLLVCLACCVVLVIASGQVVAAGPARQHAVLDLSLNGEPKGEILVFLRDGQVWAEVAALERAGLRDFAGTREHAGGAEFVDLASLAPGVAFVLDEGALQLRLTAAARLLGHAVINLGESRPGGMEYRRANSGFLNYGLSWSPGGSRSLNLESGLSIAGALATSTLFFSSEGQPLRGLTSVTLDDRKRLNRYVVGDAIAYTGPLGGSMQVAGLAVSRDFSIDPYFVRYPTAGLSGAVMTPSRLEVYVNNQLVTSASLAPGTYELNRVPLPTGAGTARVVLRDAFGGEQEISRSFYIGAGALARGVQQFQYAVGSERLRPFTDNWAYGRGAFLGSHRIGLSDTLTVGGRLEVTPATVSGGPLLAARIGRFGEVELAGAMSRDAGTTGAAGSVAYEYSARGGGFAIAFRRAAADYATVSLGATAAKPLLEWLTAGNVRIAPRVQLLGEWQATDYTRGLPGYRHGSLATSIALSGRWNLYVNGGRARFERGWQAVAFAGLTASLGHNTSASASMDVVNGDQRGALDVQRGLPVGVGYGYRFRTSGGELGGVDGEARAQTRWGIVGVRQRMIAGEASTAFDVAGGIVAIGGGLHASRPVQDGFALVRVPGVRGVRTFVSHQPVGRTDGDGSLLVPNLLPYYANRLSIADTDVPIDRSIGRTEMLLAPPYRGGAIAIFDAPREHRAAGKLEFDSIGADRVPANGHLAIGTPEGPRDLSLGTTGEFYVEGLPPGTYEAVLEANGLRCSFTLLIPVSEEPVTRLGTIVCAGARPVSRGQP